MFTWSLLDMREEYECVYVRERERERDKERKRERERLREGIGGKSRVVREKLDEINERITVDVEFCMSF